MTSRKTAAKETMFLGEELLFALKSLRVVGKAHFLLSSFVYPRDLIVRRVMIVSFQAVLVKR